MSARDKLQGVADQYMEVAKRTLHSATEIGVLARCADESIAQKILTELEAEGLIDAYGRITGGSQDTRAAAIVTNSGGGDA